MLFMNYIVALPFTQKILQLQFLSDQQHENKAFQHQNFPLKFYPHSIICHYQKAKKGQFGAQKSLRVQKLLWILIEIIVYRCYKARVLFRFFLDRILFRVFSDRVVFEFSVIESSSGSAVRDYSLDSSMLSFIFYQSCYYFFLSNTDVLFYIHYILENNQFNNQFYNQFNNFYN